ncbi:polymer biosynthesis protein, WecB/TagA/CpsF family [Pseudorhodobacter antarcticus]|jgi:exopolysaccharide biosynthesis WecB/TagA/CpsF family protein|uniref:Polymer biosynthesis protein, WecB/TagA/CpsF family n=1 Tax=Pseudorhodobacter antarcticus TaxID=1077947 RepID=A0A1H8FLK4_9RHOB|nr:WecB/TagA/CpsF family glycosyltransferase [Pseudorhodobacter antarcticus]SEN32589.1 polymer biosynthesis protein, WecB/TagA/CpsF family [Pseudorhodobacter antarcticus]
MNFVFSNTTIAITHKDAASIMAEVSARLTAGEGFALATINLDHVVKLGRDPAFLADYAAQDIVVADGNPIVWLSRMAGKAVSLTPGSDLVLPMVRAAAAAGRPVVLLGSTDDALAGAATALRGLVPGVVIGATIAPDFGFDPKGTVAEAMLAQVAALGPCLCLIALGAPKQEALAAFGRRLAPQAGFASIGAGVDFLSGHQVRAPAWVRRIAMEWFWRMAKNPRRFGPRYIGCAAILPGQMVAAIKQR